MSDMTDLDDPLRGFQPSALPPDLRARVMQAEDATPLSTLLDWLPALATAALIAVLYFAATGIRARAYAQIIEPGGVYESEVPSP